MGLYKTPSMGEYRYFLQLHNAVHSILCLNLLLLIIKHTTWPESGYEVASCCHWFREGEAMIVKFWIDLQLGDVEQGY